MYLATSILALILMLASSTALTAPALPTDAVELRQLAERYEHGRNVPQNQTKAMRLYCLATLKGDVDAYYQLGWMYFNGRGVAKSDAFAAGWFKQGAERGDPHALKMLDRITVSKQKQDHSCRLSNPTQSQIESWVKLWAPEYGLEAELVLAVIAVESNFNADAKSIKGALGLMQLIPATAKRFGVINIYDPAENMHGGMAYLQWLLRHFNGTVNYALAGYNAGEHAVKRYQGVPPYHETQTYIRRIAKLYPKTNHPTSN